MPTTASPYEYLAVLGLTPLVMVRVPRKYRHAKLMKALTVTAHHYGELRKDIHGLDPLTQDFAPCSAATAARNAGLRDMLADAFAGKTEKFGAFELWAFDGEVASLVRPRLPKG